MRNQVWTLGSGVCGLAAALIVGCGNDSAATDCVATRTCATDTPGDSDTGAAGMSTAGGDAHADPDETHAGEGGAPSGHSGEMPGLGDDGGAAGAVNGGCRSSADCSNADPTDGEETCDPSGACLPGNPPPQVVSVTPADGSAGTELDAAIVITFNEALDPDTVTASSIRLLAGDKPIAGQVTYTDKQVTFTPDSPLALLGSYEISVGTSVTDAAGAALLEPLSSNFQTRDGKWETIDAVKETVQNLAETLPITDSGEALLGWAGTTTGGECPISVRRYLRGKAVGAVKAFTSVSEGNCAAPSSAANGAGVYAVAWTPADTLTGSFVQQFRGDWLVSAPRVSDVRMESFLSLSVAPSGVTTFFATDSSGGQAWRTNAKGEWAASGDPLSDFTIQSRVQVAFDPAGNGLAVWRAIDNGTEALQRVLASRYTASSGKWSSAVEITGSLAEVSDGRWHVSVPAVAFDGKGDAMALWIGDDDLKASRFTKAGGWEEPEVLSGGLPVTFRSVPPALTFDGERFIAAWTARESNYSQYTYTSSWTQVSGWQSSERRQGASDGTSVWRMPLLGSDGRGHTMLVWAQGTTPNYQLLFQRYSEGEWSTATPIPGGSLKDNFFEREWYMPMAFNSNGLGVLAWPKRPSGGDITGIELASFY